MKQKSILKFIAGITAFILIFFLLILYNGFMGNPLSAKLADNKIKAYVDKTYPDLDLTLSETKYNFTDSSYYSKAQSNTSPDTTFMISYGRGRITDDYSYEVANCFTTYRRLSDAFTKDVEGILSQEFPYKTTIVLADYGKDEFDLNKLKLDMPYDITTPPLPASLCVYCTSKELTYEVLGERLLQLHAIMEKHKIPIKTYSLALEADEADEKPSNHRVEVIDFPADKINTANLTEELKKHQSAWEDSHKK
ncbi:hypothetical protein QA584_23165 [Anaerocolumna sp. AGMB13025]|uniref:YfjL-like protein n=1 Tax=Anaerocolumna sp. AGMB13025 TaxID=3039116 RepID=UPI00241FA8B3|nr:hypothetical protein [Anaerocolumna sp. AGMB13025]WFR56483.1 hypothetical protein QA584_23165 [Anaerocolumna sp. AGMB13025]